MISDGAFAFFSRPRKAYEETGLLAFATQLLATNTQCISRRLFNNDSATSEGPLLAHCGAILSATAL
jgi:hypothetical protein